MPEDITQTGGDAQPDNSGNAVLPQGFQLPDDLKWLADPEEALKAYNNLRTKLGERKAEADEFRQKWETSETEKRQKQEAALKEQNDFKALYEQSQQDNQRLQETLKTRDESLRKRVIENEVISTASRYNLIDWRDALLLADLSNVTVEDESVKGVEDAIKALVESKPHLVRQASTPPAQTPPPKVPPMNPSGGSTLTLEAIARMTTKEVQANWDAVQAALKNQKK